MTLRLLASLCLLSGVAAAQMDTTRAKPRVVGIIDGLVSDSALAPLDDVTVSFVGGTTQLVTGTNGRFRFLEVPVGTHRILARRIGSEPVIAEVHVVDGEVVRPAMILLPTITELKGVRVEGERGSANFQEFDARRKLGLGYFLTAEQIDKSHVVYAGDLIGRFPNIKVETVLGSGTAKSLRMPLSEQCPMAVVVDGMPRGINLADIPPPRELMGIEVYHGPATIPLQYKRWAALSPGSRGAGFCGLILAWTKDGSRP